MDAAGERAPREVEELARRVLSILGARPSVVQDGPALAKALGAHGVPVVPIGAEVPESSSLCLYSGKSEATPAWLERALKQAPAGIARALVVVPRGAHGRADFEGAAFAAGFRRHPLTLLVQGYGALEHEPEVLELWLERVPEEALRRYPMETLRRERDLHMDMLRESGRRSDAHLARYQLAVSFVRPNDVVLDVACGLGYGSALLWDATPASRVIGVDDSAFATDYARENFTGARPGLEYRRGDACDLSALPDASVDVVVSFETIEHLREPERFLAEAQRVLTPGGRLIGSVPYLWVDETGKDPNPYHFHVFDLARLKALCGKYFLHEQFFGQDAGGGMTRTHEPRRLWELKDADAEPATEWLLYVGMKDPVASHVPYRETLYPGVPPERALTSFARDYENPWLVRSLVSIGMRARSNHLLTDLAERTLRHASAHSADAGAALAVLAYRALERGGAELDGPLWTRVHEYVAQPGGNPHVERWRISLAYVVALRDRALGRPEARRDFEEVSRRDALSFSPHLATKTIEAAFQAGWMAFTAKDLAAARASWTQGLAAARAAFHAPWEDQIGSEEDPPLFALREMVQVADLASRCANGLNLTSRSAGREHLVSAQVFHSPLRDTAELRSEVERLAPFEEESARSRSELSRLQSELSAAQQAAGNLRAQLEEVRSGAAWAEDQRGRWEKSATELKTWADEQAQQIAALKRELAELRGVREGLIRRADTAEGRTRQLEGEVAALRVSEERLRNLEQYLPLGSLEAAAARLLPANSLRADLARRLAGKLSRPPVRRP